MNEKYIKAKFLEPTSIGSSKLKRTSILGDRLANGTVTFSKLAPGAVLSSLSTAPNSVDGATIKRTSLDPIALKKTSLTGAYIKRTSIIGDNLTRTSITGSKIAAETLTVDKLANASVSTVKLQDSGVTTQKLANTSVNASKLAPGAVTTEKLALGSVGPDQIARTSLTAQSLAPGAVTLDSIGNTSITGAKIANNSVDGSKLVDTSVTVSKLANNIPGSKLANTSVSSQQLSTNAVTTSKITDGAITTDKLGAGSVTPDKIQPTSLTGAQMADNSVNGSKLANSSVADTKLAEKYLKTNGSRAMEADLNFDNWKGINAAPGTAPGDLVTVSQLQSLSTSLNLLPAVNAINVLSDIVGTPPATPAQGDAFVVASGAIGAWAGLDNHLVEYDGAAWYDHGDIDVEAAMCIVVAGWGLASATGTFAGHEFQHATRTAGSWQYTVPSDGDFLMDRAGWYEGKAFEFQTNIGYWREFFGFSLTNAGAGLQFNTNTLSVDLGKGLQLSGNKVVAKLADGRSLEFDPTSSGLSVKLSATGGLIHDSGLAIAPTGISTTMLANSSVTSSKLGTASVTANALAAASVGTSALGATAVVGSKIAPGAVTSDKLAAGAVAGAIADGSVSGSKLIDTSVSGVKIANSTLTGTKFVAKTIPASKLFDTSLTALQLASASVTTPKLADASVTNSKLALTSITADKLAPGAVTLDAVADSSLTGAKIANTSISGIKLVDGTVNGSKLIDTSLSGSKLSNNSVDGGSKLINTSLTGLKIASQTIDNSKLAPSTLALGSFATATLDGLNIEVGGLTDTSAGHGHSLRITRANMITLISTGTVDLVSDTTTAHTHTVTLTYDIVRGIVLGTVTDSNHGGSGHGVFVGAGGALLPNKQDRFLYSITATDFTEVAIDAKTLEIADLPDTVAFVPAAYESHSVLKNAIDYCWGINATLADKGNTTPSFNGTAKTRFWSVATSLSMSYNADLAKGTYYFLVGCTVAGTPPVVNVTTSANGSAVATSVGVPLAIPASYTAASLTPAKTYLYAITVGVNGDTLLAINATHATGTLVFSPLYADAVGKTIVGETDVVLVKTLKSKASASSSGSGGGGVGTYNATVTGAGDWASVVGGDFDGMYSLTITHNLSLTDNNKYITSAKSNGRLVEVEIENVDANSFKVYSTVALADFYISVVSTN